MSATNVILADLQRRAKYNCGLVKEWVADVEEPFSTTAVQAVDKGLMAFVQESIKTPISNLAPSVKYRRRMFGCEVELCFWKEKGGGGERGRGL